MSEPIKVGDLVAVVKPGRARCCDGGLGAIFTVTSIGKPLRSNGGTGWSCSFCGRSGNFTAPDTDAVAEGLEGVTGIPVRRLKRIPPLSELEGERTQEDISEPA